jgi:hypothetical protein
MSEQQGEQTPKPGQQAEEPREPKPIEKVKADNEKPPEKAKIEQEKLKPEGEKLGKGEIEKIKSDHEKGKFEQEKIKPEAEKFPKVEMEKVKPDKEKVEFKEHKLEKVEVKEHKLEKPEIKEHKLEKVEVKEQKLDFEKPAIPEKGVKEAEQAPSGAGPLPIDRETLIRHAEALESMGRELRHFIEQSERPDLNRGALRNEPDQQGTSQDSG